MIFEKSKIAGWIILFVIIIISAFISMIYGINQYISTFILLTALLPGYFIYIFTSKKSYDVYKKKHVKKIRLNSKKDKGKVLNFPKGGRNDSYKN